MPTAFPPGSARRQNLTKAARGTDVLNEVLAARKQLRQAPYYATALVVWFEAEPKLLTPDVSRFAP